MNRYASKMKELNATPIGFPTEQPIHLSEDDLQEAERQLGTRLPEDYREFVRDFGVFGVPTVIFPVRSNPDDIDVGSPESFKGIVRETRRIVWDIVSNYKSNCESYGDDPTWSTNWLVIADAGGGSVVLSIKGEDKGAVYYYLNATGNYTAYLIADSFDEFMQLLESAHNELEAKEHAERFWSTYKFT